MQLNTYKLLQPILSNNRLLRAEILKIKTTFEGKLKSGDVQTKKEFWMPPVAENVIIRKTLNWSK